MSLTSDGSFRSAGASFGAVLTVVAVLAIGMLARLDATILQLFHLSH